MPDDIFESDCIALVNATNTRGVMGGGIAYAFAKRFPEMLEDYKRACQAGEHKIGELHTWEEGGKIIYNVATMEYPGMAAKLDDIREGLRDLRSQVEADTEVDSVAIPALGCGIGGLNWPDVEALIKEHFSDLDGVRVELYPPDAPKYTL